MSGQSKTRPVQRLKVSSANAWRKRDEGFGSDFLVAGLWS